MITRRGRRLSSMSAARTATTWRRLPREGPALVIDFAGNDHYRTGAVAMFDLGIQLDLAGDDIYRAPDAGDGAAVGGIAIVHDLAGDDFHEASHFAQGAAIGGFAVLIDDAGDDRYRIGSRGQGFGGPLGFGALIDRAGADDYLAAEGFADPFARSGGDAELCPGCRRGLSRLARWRGRTAPRSRR